MLYEEEPHPRDFGKGPAATTAPDGLRVGEAQRVSLDDLFQGQVGPCRL